MLSEAGWYNVKIQVAATLMSELYKLKTRNDDRIAKDFIRYSRPEAREKVMSVSFLANSKYSQNCFLVKAVDLFNKMGWVNITLGSLVQGQGTLCAHTTIRQEAIGTLLRNGYVNNNV